MSKANIDIETFEVHCKVYGCTKRAKYKIGNLSGSPAAFFHLCEDHAKDIIESLPTELQPTPKEVKVYPTEEELKELIKGMQEGDTEIPFSEEPLDEEQFIKKATKKKVSK